MTEAAKGSLEHIGMRRSGRMLAATAIVGAALSAWGTGCKTPAQLDAKRKEMLAAATPCPAPETCTGKARAVDTDVSTCAPLDTKALVAGDVVIVKELVVHDTIARVKSNDGGLKIEFVDGFVLDRGDDKIVARICK